MNRDKIIEKIVEDYCIIERMITKKTHLFSGKIKITPSQFRLLCLIEENKPMSIKDLAKKFGTSRSATTQTVNKLVNIGSLSRRRNPSDRRLVKIEMSNKFKKQFHSIKKKRINALSTIFNNLDDKEIRKYKILNVKIAKSYLLRWK